MTLITLQDKVLTLLDQAGLEEAGPEIAEALRKKWLLRHGQAEPEWCNDGEQGRQAEGNHLPFRKQCCRLAS